MINAINKLTRSPFIKSAPTICSTITNDETILHMPGNPEIWSKPLIDIKSPLYKIFQNVVALYKEVIEQGLFDKSASELTTEEKALLDSYFAAMEVLEGSARDLFQDIYLGELPGLDRSVWEDFLSEYYIEQGQTGLYSPVIELLSAMSAPVLTLKDQKLLFEWAFSGDSDPAVLAQITQRFIECYRQILIGYDGFSIPNSAEANFVNAFLLVANNQEFYKDNLSALMVAISSIDLDMYLEMDKAQLKKIVEQTYKDYLALPSGNVHKIRNYQLLQDLYLICMARAISDLQMENYLEGVSEIVGGEEGLRCATRVEDLPADYQIMLRDGDYYDYALEYQGQGIVLADLREDNAFTDTVSIYIEDWQVDQRIAFAWAIVHEAAHIEFHQIAPEELWENGPANERHARIHQMLFIQNYLNAHGDQLLAENPQDYYALADALVYCIQIIRYYNFILGYDLEDFNPDNFMAPISRSGGSGQSIYAEQSNTQPQLLFLSTATEIDRILTAYGADIEEIQPLRNILVSYLIEGQPLTGNEERILQNVFGSTDPVALIQYLLWMDAQVRMRDFLPHE
jgi:hypothetical protein